MKKKRILVVDDKEEAVYFLQCLLQSHGHEVISTSQGAEALEAARRSPPDLIISDILMPGMDGFTLCREWKKDESLKHIPFVFYTATYTDERDREFALSLGANQFIVKPQEPDVFVGIIRESLEQVADVERAGPSGPDVKLPAEDATAALKQYNEVLIRKLESKMQQLEHANRQLEQDIAAREKTEEALRAAKISAERARAAAEEASRAKDVFISTLSHELRTPLSPCLAAVQLMERSENISEEMRGQLCIVHRNLKLEARLIDDLLDLTRIVRGKIELEEKAIDVCAVIERAAEMCKQDIEARKLHFELDIKEPPHLIKGDVSRLQQVVWNLLKNSIKFTAEGGCISIRSRREETTIVIEVADSGVGIEPEVLPRLFGAFEQGNRPATHQFGGLGLGLAISRRLVELHGGTVSASSAGKGHGATFRVVLPMLEITIPTSEEVSRPESPSRRILLVEDHGDTAMMMQLLLQDAGYEVQIAGDVQQALNAIGAKHFDLLVSDLGLPDRSGLDLMKEIRFAGNHLKSIALSGFGREEDIRNCKDAGFDTHLTKPIDVDRLIRTIESLST